MQVILITKYWTVLSLLAIFLSLFFYVIMTSLTQSMWLFKRFPKNFPFLCKPPAGMGQLGGGAHQSTLSPPLNLKLLGHAGEVGGCVYVCVCAGSVSVSLEFSPPFPEVKGRERDRVLEGRGTKQALVRP